MQKPKNFIRERVIGGYTITLPEPPAAKDIANFYVKQENQKFTRTELPKDLRKWEPEARKDFILKEWEKRLNGYWFYNNGNIEYITGAHYFYLNWWYINTGYPMFVDADRDFFYFWKMCEDDPKCDGMIYITRRGDGKTVKAISAVYEPIARKYNVQAGIQSKNEPDAKKIFAKLIFSWSKLPYFFRPIDIGISRPTRVLNFGAPSVRNTKSQEKEDEDVLNSFIDFEDAGVAAYDGQTLHRIFVDEFGKTIECDVNERMNTLRECLRAGRGQYGRGKILATTTVEEMLKKGGANCKKVWNRADASKLDGNGQTQNGMYRLFNPANIGFLEVMDGQTFVDEYGYSDKEKAFEFFMNRRKSLKGADLNSEKRKYPLYEKDIWVSDSKMSMYDTDKIDAQMEYNDSIDLDKVLVRGDFKWKDGIIDSTVVWHPHAKGKWLVAWMPELADRNKQLMKHGLKHPGNTEVGAFGLDPYDNKTTVDGRKSDAASYGLMRFNPLKPYDTGNFISEYVNRPELPEEMWEDMILEAVFYGWEILIENNKIGTINHFRRRGYIKYLMHRPEETQTASSRKMEEPGIPMSGDDARMALIYATQSHINQRVGMVEEEGREPYMGRCYFNKLLENWKEFDFDRKWTEFDSMVGAGMAILGSRKYLPKKVAKGPIKLFETYDGSGMMSTRIE
jgi:hypothetical protein